MVGDTYQQILEGVWVSPLLEALVAGGAFRKVERGGTPISPALPVTVKTITLGKLGYLAATEETSENFSLTEGVDKYLSNHMPIEGNIEKISTENLGFFEEKRWWKKDLSTAVKQYGHDEVLSAFYEWSSSQSNFLGKKPITTFLRTVGSLVGMSHRKPAVSNPALDSVERDIAYKTDSRVFFTGDYRIRLARLLKDSGKNLVLEAFLTFYSSVDDKSIPFAAKNFLERADILIDTLKRQQHEQRMQESIAIAQMEAAKQQITEEPEETEEEL
jgi:hypothetical protein